MVKGHCVQTQCGLSTRRGELWLGSLDRGLERLLTKEAGYAAWSPDGRAIAYIEWPDQTVRAEVSTVMLLDLESGQEIEAGITDFTYWLDFTPNSKLVYHRQGELRLFDPTLRSERAVPEVTVANNPPYYYSECKFSPDGKRIAGLEVAYDRGVLTVVDIETGQRIKISDQIGPPWGPFDWSPDGQQLAYSIVLEETRFPELYYIPSIWISILSRNSYTILQPTHSTRSRLAKRPGAGFRAGQSILTNQALM